MKSYCIHQKRIRKLSIPKEYDINKIQIGVPVYTNEAAKVGLFEIQDIVLPSGMFGVHSKRNAYGYQYTDKNKPKEYRYVSTICGYPFGNSNASMFITDLYKECFPKVFVDPFGIEFQLYANDEGQLFVIALMTDEIRTKYLKETINLFLEIYGVCYIFEKEIQLEDFIRKERCNWEILPPGTMPSKHIKKQQMEYQEKFVTFNIIRLEYIESLNPEKIVEGINGFKGYYAYIFEDCCVLESAIYGNATYIIPKENWEVFSQMTKKELFDTNKVIARIEHRQDWKNNIANNFKEIGMI